MVQPLEIARRAAAAGGAVVARDFESDIPWRGKTTDSSEPSTPYNLVTDADLQSEQAVAQVIREAYPDHAILGEETLQADLQAPDLWIIDPLDGTNNFAHHIPHFAVSVAYLRDGAAQCGVVYNPIRDDWYLAQRGQGASCNGRPCRVSPAQHLQESLIGVGFYYDRGAMMEATLAAIRDLFHAHIHGIRRFGTAALDLCQVGCGQFGAFFEYQLAPWDFAAGALFVQEAGGRVTTCQGAPLPVAKTSLLASNGALHERMLEVVGQRWG